MPVVCLSLKEVFWKIVSIAYHWPLPLIRAYFSLRSATGFISWEGRKKSTFTTLTGQLSVGHRRSSRASLCKAFSVQVCILPADPKGINSLSSYMQSLPASRVCRQGDELVYLNYRWASERFINLLWDTQQSKKVGNWLWMLDVDIKGKSVKAQFEILSLVSPVHQGQPDVDMIKSQAPVYPQQRNSHSNSHLILCT